jgi:WXXGXW repeat (2 copies)
MRVRKELLSLLLITASTVAAPVTSYAGVNVDIDIAPPALRVETAPPARVGYVWGPGYWRYDHGRHVWVGGRWLRERRGYHYVAETWVQAGPHWHFQPGHWER